MSEFYDLTTLITKAKRGQKEDAEKLLKFEGTMEAVINTVPHDSDTYMLASAFLMLTKLTRAFDASMVTTWEILSKLDSEIKALKGDIESLKSNDSLQVKKLEQSICRDKRQAQYVKVLLGLQPRASDKDISKRAKKYGRFVKQLVKKGQEWESEEKEKKRWT